MAVERSGVEGERDSVGVRQRADLERRPGRPHGLEPSDDVVGRRRARQRLRERLRRPHEHPALDRGDAPVGRVERNTRRIAEARFSSVLDHHVAPDAHVEGVERHRQHEMPPVHGRRQVLPVSRPRHRRSLSPGRGRYSESQATAAG